LTKKRHLSDLIYFFTFIFLALHFSGYLAHAGQTGTVGDEEKVYAHYCAPCHGIKGDGKGFNAQHLDPRPANHRDAQFMNRRSDRELHDAIKGGGKAVGKSTLMPPWGETLSETQISSLVSYLRKLCKCPGM
jgi:mono/diheme cytochrome c family protein